MTADRKFQRPLTDDELDRITAAITEATTPTGALAAAVRGFFDIALLEVEGHDWAEAVRRRDKIAGTDYAIPADQFERISQHILRRAEQLSTSLTTVNVLLDWINFGPSTYDGVIDHDGPCSDG